MRKGKLAIFVYIVLSIVLASFTVVDIEDGFGIKKAGATTTTISLNATDDARISHRAPDINLGDDEYLKVRNEFGGSGPGWASNTLVKFDLLGLNPGVIVYSAKLYLWFAGYQDTNPNGRPITVYRITQDWDENTVTWNTKPTYTYNSTDTTNVSMPPGYWMTWNVTSDIQDFMNGNISHFGYRVADEKYWGKEEIPISLFSSKEGTHIPHLIIEYESVISPPDMVYVDDDYTTSTPGWGYIHFDNIQDGIDAVAVNGTVCVYSGGYGGQVVVNKTINLIGNGSTSTFIEGGSADVITVSADWVNISGFTLTNFNPGGTGITLISSSNNTITGNNITGHLCGIFLSYSSNNNTVMGNTITHNHNYPGIDLFYSSGNTIMGNAITNNTNGIKLYSSNINTIMGNMITNNIEHGIYLNHSHNNTIMGNTITHNVKSGIELHKSDNNTISNCSILGNNNGIWAILSNHTSIISNYINDGWAGIIFNDSSNCVVQNNTLTDNLGWGGISSGSGSNHIDILNNNILNNTQGMLLSDSSKINVINNNIAESDNYGLSLVFCNNNTITGNIITKNAGVGFYIWHSSSNTIVGNNITNNDDGIAHIYSNSNIIKENTITKNNHFSIRLLSSNNNTILDNTITNNTNWGISLYSDCNSNIITGNTIKYSWFGINLTHNCINNTITGNTITHNDHGITLEWYSNYNTIMGNTIKNNSNYGIFICCSSNYNNVTDNTITNNDYGIYLYWSCNNTITGNTITNNTDRGIYLVSSTHCNNITVNTITHNGEGINFTGSDENKIEDNVISQNQRGISILASDSNYVISNVVSLNSPYQGIYLGGANNNHIYHNNFINDNNAYISYSGANIWDNGYPSGGNHWSDYTGIDADGDGIGDTPYNIWGDSNQDRYPLMYLYGETSIVEFQGLEPLYTTEYIEIAISIDPNEAIAGAQFDLSFDPDMLSIDWVAEGNVFSGYDTYFNGGVIDNTNGSLKNVVSLITTPGCNTTNQGSIAIVAIRAKTIPGETPLNLSNVVVGRPDATPIEVTIINTTVTIYHHDRWDVNWDDRVNILDLIVIAQWWGEIGTPCWVPADVNCDGVINILDMVLVGQHWTG